MILPMPPSTYGSGPPCISCDSYILSNSQFLFHELAQSALDLT